jgi:hypothetical protein
MSRMFQRVLATSVIGAAALAAPVTAMAADVGCGGGTGPATTETPTAIVVHLPKHVEADEPVTVTARITPQSAAQPGKDQDGKGEGKGKKGKHKDKSGQGDAQQGKDGGKDTKGDEPGKEGKGGHHGRKGTGHGKKKHHRKGVGGLRRHAVTGEVEFFLDGKPQPPVEVSRDQASEKIEIPLGKHTIFAEYSGDGNFEPAKSAPVTFELANDPDGQGAQNGEDPNGHAGTSTQTGENKDGRVGLTRGRVAQADPDGGRDSGDLAPGDQDPYDWGQGADDQDGPEDEA